MGLLRHDCRDLCEPLQFDLADAGSIRPIEPQEPVMHTQQPAPEPNKRRWPFGYGEEE